MTERSEHLERVLSEHSDGTLAAEELADFRRAVDGDAAAAETARQYARLNDLLGDWRVLPEGIAWGTFARAASPGEAGDAARHAVSDSQVGTEQGVDHLLEAWGGEMPEVDWDAFGSRVSSAVRREAVATIGDLSCGTGVPPVVLSGEGGGKQRSWWRAVSRAASVGVPLAAAAVIAIAVWAPKTDVSVSPGVEEPAESIVLVSLEMPEPLGLGQVSVTFEEMLPEAAENGHAPMGGVAIAVGPSAADYVTYEEPVDEALFY